MNHTITTENTLIVTNIILPTPREVKEMYPLSADLKAQIHKQRQEISDAVHGKDPRLVVVVGPCAIYDIKAGLEYADKLAALVPLVSRELILVMRVYFEKPRTTVGWKGLINDPHLDDSFKIEEGLLLAREFMHAIAQRGLPIATEALDPIVPQYLGDLVAWNAIGARTTESQTHREMSSGLSTPVGFKNGTDGNVMVAINAIKAASATHRFLGINQFGQCSVFHTKGNPDGHVVLRGGKSPNYDAASVKQYVEALKKEGLAPAIMVDCSHGNSNKDYTRQPQVCADVMNQLRAGERAIIGIMLESNLKAGKQELGKDLSKLEYGVSITDGCIDWDTTEHLLKELALCVKSAREL